MSKVKKGVKPGSVGKLKGPRDHRQEARDNLALAKVHLLKVQAAWDEPTDWSDLTMYGFYCLENAVEAAAAAVGKDVERKHWVKADVGEELAKDHKLPEISDLLRDLNEARKHFAYGDIEFDKDEFDPEDLAIQIEGYVVSVEELLKKQGC